ncbi:MAG: hypothetical protein ABW043_16900 [Devosia sp.]|uniref:hypothetical protein n=1 Tax=Devosia sp. TaxID=1871048 RepID=UPI0033964EBA
MAAAKVKSHPRTTHGLRDILFDEIDRMRSDQADPQRAMAVANLSKQIISTAKVELEFHRTMANLAENGAPVSLGTLALGSA